MGTPYKNKSKHFVSKIARPVSSFTYKSFQYVHDFDTILLCQVELLPGVN